MAGRVELKGQIGTQKNMLPTEFKTANGRVFKTFKMWAENYCKAPTTNDNGNRRFQRSPVQVVVPNNERGEKLMKLLRGGRRIMVKGRLDFAPNIGTNKDGEQVPYANPRVYMENLEFMDEPPASAAERVLNTLLECSAINDEQKNQMMAAFNNHQETLQGNTSETSEEIDEDVPF
jgi:hypothetical protein